VHGSRLFKALGRNHGKQISGLCEAFGVQDNQTLFAESCRVVVGVLKMLTVDQMVKYVHGPNQTDLARLLQYSKLEWRSRLTNFM